MYEHGWKGHEPVGWKRDLTKALMYFQRALELGRQDAAVRIERLSARVDVQSSASAVDRNNTRAPVTKPLLAVLTSELRGVNK